MLDVSQSSVVRPWEWETIDPPRAYAGLLARALRRSSRLLALWRARAQQRGALAEMDDRLLDDIGITRTQAERECAKPFWR